MLIFHLLERVSNLQPVGSTITLCRCATTGLNSSKYLIKYWPQTWIIGNCPCFQYGRLETKLIRCVKLIFDLLEFSCYGHWPYCSRGMFTRMLETVPYLYLNACYLSTRNIFVINWYKLLRVGSKLNFVSLYNIFFVGFFCSLNFPNIYDRLNELSY